MIQERRWNPRLPTAMEVVVYYGGLGLVQCRTRDVSYDGAFIETGRIALTTETDVELVFSSYSGSKHTQHRITAQIARVTLDGAGLSFSDLEISTYRFLQQLLSNSKQDNMLGYL